MTLPPTVHPMLVHFPIALLFTSFLMDALAVWRRDTLLERMGFILLWLTLASAAMAIVAGLYAETHVLPQPGVRHILREHRRDGILTGLAIAAVVFARIRTRRRPSAGLTADTLQQTLKIWVYPLGTYGLALILISITGHLGGTMVYGHGLGVASAPNRVTATRPPTPTHNAQKSPAAAAGRQIYASTCSHCHGATPPFTHSLVASMGASSMQTFISTRMPPGHPVSSAQAHQLVHYFQTL